MRSGIMRSSSPPINPHRKDGWYHEVGIIPEKQLNRTTTKIRNRQGNQPYNKKEYSRPLTQKDCPCRPKHCTPWLRILSMIARQIRYHQIMSFFVVAFPSAVVHILRLPPVSLVVHGLRNLDEAGKVGTSNQTGEFSLGGVDILLGVADAVVEGVLHD